MEDRKPRPATVADVHELAQAMPYVTRLDGSQGKPVYQVGGKSFIFFRNSRPDAADPVTGERYDDVIVFWVESEADKQSLIDDPGSPFFTNPHFNGHLIGLNPRKRSLGHNLYGTKRNSPRRLALKSLHPPREGMAKQARVGVTRARPGRTNPNGRNATRPDPVPRSWGAQSKPHPFG